MKNKNVLAWRLIKILGGRTPAEDRSDDILDKVMIAVKQYADDGEVTELLNEVIAI